MSGVPFRWPLRRQIAPLTGAPQMRRQKSYSAQSGYVYQYYYEGQREFSRGKQQGTEFVFNVSADRKTSMAVSVMLENMSVEAWEAGHGRPLASTERYAIAKMALFQAFDERPQPDLMKQEILVRAADVSGILETLGID